MRRGMAGGAKKGQNTGAKGAGKPSRALAPVKGKEAGDTLARGVKGVVCESMVGLSAQAFGERERERERAREKERTSEGTYASYL
jgi:hypothetical protein